MKKRLIKAKVNSNFSMKLTGDWEENAMYSTDDDKGLYNTFTATFTYHGEPMTVNGNVEARMDLENGKIVDIELYGDNENGDELFAVFESETKDMLNNIDTESAGLSGTATQVFNQSVNNMPTYLQNSLEDSLDNIGDAYLQDALNSVDDEDELIERL